MKRHFACLLLALLIFTFLAIPASADSICIDDGANLLSFDEVRLLESQTEEIAEKYEIDIVIVTVDSMDGKYASYYAERYYDENGFSRDGILLLVAMEEREWYILTSGECYDVFTDRNLDRLEDALLDDLSNGDYYDAFSNYLDTLSGCMENADSPVGSQNELNIGVSILVGLAAAIVTVLIMASQMKTAKPQHHAIGYIRDDSYRITEHRDMFLYSRITKTPKPQNNGSSGRSGGGSRGGRGGRF